MGQDIAAEVRAVPFFDPRPTFKGLEPAILADFAELLESGMFVNGPQVARFEEAFAGYCGVAHCVGVASGLDALRLALLAAGIEPGDEVIAPAHTFVATLEAISQVGGQPVLVDVREADGNIDPAAVESAITPRTRALLPVHLYGQLADMVALRAIAERHGVVVIEDAAQAHGASRDGHRPGSSALAAAFSFYPAKNLGAFGDAGACVTGDERLATRVRSLREHGQPRRYEHEEIGYTARLDTIQAVALAHKLPLLDGWIVERRAIARAYSEALADVGDLRLPSVPEGSDPVWHLYVVRTSQPERLAARLSERGVDTGRHYPHPVHLTGAYAGLGYRQRDFPVAEAIAAEGLSLPIFPGMSEEQVAAVIEAVTAAFERR